MHHFHTCTEEQLHADQHTNAKCLYHKAALLQPGCQACTHPGHPAPVSLAAHASRTQARTHTHMHARAHTHTCTHHLPHSPSLYHEISVYISQMHQANLPPKASPTQSELTYRQRQQDTQAPRPRH